MSLILRATHAAVAPGITASFGASGGTGPYVYSVVAGGAGGTINSSTGIYTAPSSVNSDPAKALDTITVVDSLAASATLSILVGSPLQLVCEIIQNEMSLTNGRVYLWDQKINQPKDNDLYIAVSVLQAKPFGITTRFDSSGEPIQSVNIHATLSIDIISRGLSALNRKEEVLLALNSFYSQRQQEANGFYIGKLSTSFVNLSNLDGAAIPYRFNISVALQYFSTKTKAVDYFDDFQTVSITDEP